MVENHERQITDQLLEFTRTCALQEAGRHGSAWVDCQDVVQQVMLGLLAKPPKYDPSKGASEKTLIHTVVRRIVPKYVARESSGPAASSSRHGGRRQASWWKTRPPETNCPSNSAGVAPGRKEERQSARGVTEQAVDDGRRSGVHRK